MKFLVILLSCLGAISAFAGGKENLLKRNEKIVKKHIAEKKYVIDAKTCITDNGKCLIRYEQLNFVIEYYAQQEPGKKQNDVLSFQINGVQSEKIENGTWGPVTNLAQEIVKDPGFVNDETLYEYK